MIERRGMKCWIHAIVLGGVGAVVLLIVAFLTGLRSGFMWLSELAFYPGDHLYPFARKSGILEISEGLHHQFVLFVSLLSWWLVMTLFVRCMRRRKGDK